MDTILVTDTLFILPEHEEKIKAAGFAIERIAKPKPTEEELITAIKGKVGYILGGIEDVTEKVIDAADKLKVITFTGIEARDFISGWDKAVEKGIEITDTPDGPTHAVAEWAITMALAMNRNLFDLGRVGKKEFDTTRGLENQAVGIIGYGRIGKHIADIIKPFRPSNVLYYSRSTKNSELNDLLKKSDVIFLCLNKHTAVNFMNKELLGQMKKGSLLVSFMHPGVIEVEALYQELKSGRIRCVSDYAMDKRFNELPLSTWYCFNGSNAFNTISEIKLVSDQATESIINILKKFGHFHTT